MSAAKASMSNAAPSVGAKVMTPPTCIALVRSSAKRNDASSGERRSGTTPRVGCSAVAGRGAGRPRWRGGGRTAHRCRRAGDAVLGQEPVGGEPGRHLDGGPGRPADGDAADRMVVAGGP